MAEERSVRLPLRVDPAVLVEIHKQDDPFAACKIVLMCSVEDAISIIDNLNQLAAALILGLIRLAAMDGDEHAKTIFIKAEVERVRGSAGLLYARDKVFRETGFFAGI